MNEKIRLPPNWEAIVEKSCREFGDELDGIAIDVAIKTVERCYALHTKPKQELTDAELSKAYSQATIGTAGTHIAGLRGVEAAVWAKQQEPETVTFRAARRKGDKFAVMVELPCNLDDGWEWVDRNGEPQEIEVVLP